MKHGIMKWVGIVSWAVTALVSINVGLLPFGFDFFTTEFMLVTMASFIMPLYYFILFCGIASLAFLIMSCMGGCGCGKSSCGCI